MIGMNESDWDDLKYYVRRKKITAFIGPELSSHYIGSQKSDQWFPLLKELADEWAEKYPLEKPSHLSRMAQYIAIVGNNELRPKTILASRIESISLPDFSMEKYRKTPYAILADLNLPVYITTNYDHLMEKALEDKGKKPVNDFCRWNKFDSAQPIASSVDSRNPPTEYKPLVFHLHGDIREPNSMVLTENDYIDFIISLSKNEELLPSIIIQRLAMTLLLFIGYSLEDINFRVILKSFNLLDNKGIAILLPRSDSKYQKYQDQYLKKMLKIRVHWQEANKFSEVLRKRWDHFKSNR